MSTPLVSVIMPVHNGGSFVSTAITSVLAQDHERLQLIVVNDGSTDGTAPLLDAISDPRVLVAHQARHGVSHARNTALVRAEGEFICFLDADDHMPPGALTHRLAMFDRNPALAFVDGKVIYCDAELHPTGRVYVPAFTGDPFPLLLAFDRRCFFGNTWMIRHAAIGNTRFNERLTHGEDLMFYLEIAQGKQYDHTSEPVLHYRVTGVSSMIALERLERCYHDILQWMRERPEDVRPEQLRTAVRKVRRMMCGAYWNAGKPFKAIAALMR